MEHGRREATRVRAGVLVLALMAMRAWAAGEVDGRVVGEVTDPDGVPLARVSVRLARAGDPEARAALTGPDGRFHFEAVPPGEDYRLFASFEGFLAEQVPVFSVRLGETTRVALKLLRLSEEPGAGAAVRAEVETVQVPRPDGAQTGAVLALDDVDRLPTFRQVEALSELIPGVGPGSRPNVRGVPARFSAVFVDGFDASDARDGRFAAPVPYGAVQSVEVLTGGLDARFGALGMIENIVTRDGMDGFRAEGELVWSPGWLSVREAAPTGLPVAASALPDAPPSPARTFFSPSLSVGGPIISGRLSAFLSAQLSRSGAPGPSEDRETATALGRLKLTWRGSGADVRTLSLALDDNVVVPDCARCAVEAANRLARRGGSVAADVRQTLTSSLRLRVAAGIAWKSVDVDPRTPTELPSRADVSRGWTEGAAGRVDADEPSSVLHTTRRQIQFDPSLAWDAGDHRFTLGLQSAWLTGVRRGWLPGGARLLSRGPCDPVGLSGCGVREEVDPLEAASELLRASAFVQDHWELGRRLTLHLGVRVDVGLLQPAGASARTLWGWGPRASAVWDVAGDGRHLLLAHVGRAHDVGALFLVERAGPAPTVRERTLDGGRAADCPSPGCIQFGGSSHLGALDPVRLDEAAIGYHALAFSETSAGIDLTWRRLADLWIDEETNRVTGSDGATTGFLDGSFRSVHAVRSLPGTARVYRGVDLWIQGTPGPFDVLASWTLSRTDGRANDVFDPALVDARTRAVASGPLPDDFRHLLKAAVSYRAPIPLELGARLRYRSGAPLWETFPVPDALGRRTVRTPRGTGLLTRAGTVFLRQPDLLTLDLQARAPLGTAFGWERLRFDVTLLVSHVLGGQAPSALSASAGALGAVALREPPTQGEVLVAVRW